MAIIFQIFYAVFLGMYSFISLVKTPLTPSMPELYVLVWMITTACELFRTFHALEPVELMLKMRCVKIEIYESLHF